MLIIFDYFGVIAQDHFWFNAQAGFGEHGTDDEMRSMAKHMNLGEISWDAYCLAVSLDVHVSVDDVKKRYEDHRITPHIIGLIHDIKAKGHTVVLLSNASAEYLMPVMHKLGLDKLFERIFVSSDMHYIKPDPRAYKYVLAEMGATARGATMIDDRAENVSEAKKLGMQGILFDTTSGCRKELKSLAIL